MAEVLNERISKLSREERALLFQRLREKREKEPATGDRRGRIERRPRPEALPLSFAQQRLWFLDQLDPGQVTYNMSAAYRLSGVLLPEALRGALQAVVDRHESLRTTFHDEAGRPVQVIAPHLAFALPQVDLSAIGPADRDAERRRLQVEESLRPFDLAAGPLVRTILLRLATKEHVLLLGMHHIVSDGWSSGVLVSEMAELYAAAAEGRPARLPELPIQYADFALWQREWLQGEELERQLGYWREQLAGVPEVLRLPADFPPPARPTPAGGHVHARVGVDVMERLQALAREERTTLFVVLLAAFGVLLSRWCDQEDLPIATAVANRNRAETAGLIGFFVNTLVLRLDLSRNPVFRGLLRQTGRVALGVYDHQDLPFEKLLEEMRPDRNAARSPLAQTMLVLQNVPARQPVSDELTCESLPYAAETAKFELSVSAVEAPWALRVDFEYSRDLFARSTIRRMADSFVRLLGGIAADPERCAAELPLLSAAERQQLLVEWNDTAAPEAVLPAHRLFALQAEQRPAALALVCGTEAVTSGDLAARAWRVAHRLRRLGVGAETRVGLFAERSADLAAGLLGILAAGGAFVPLDPATPRERLALLLEDAAPPVLLTQTALRGSLPEHGARVLCLDDEAEGWAAEPADAPEPCESPGDLAYLIYTSGTTGRPKAVQAEHGNLANLLAASQRAFGWSADDRMLALAPSAFDIFLFELLSPLAAGGTCELIPLRPALELETVLRALQTATRFHAVPALMRQIVGALTPGPSPIRTVFVGGDAVPADLLAGLRRVFPQAEVRILYGPTEGTIFCSSLRVPAEGLPFANPAGSPLANMALRVVGRNGEIVPLGAPGEIWIGGAGVTRGYLHRDNLTAERYVVADGARWYRTGDLARWRPAGSLEFLGRIDDQVKVRGHRVEPGEIKAVLAGHPRVREAAVVVREDRATGDRSLVACVVPAPAADGESPLAWPALRAFLRERLPEAMIPAAGVVLESFPLTAHGKVDRKALARLGEAAAAERSDLATPFVAPRTPLEEVLAGFWAEVLGLRAGQRVGAEDDFFELGGHSLLATQLVSKVRGAFQVEVPLRALFEAPTVAGLARHVLAAEGTPGRSETIARVLLRLRGMSAAQKREALMAKKEVVA